MTVLYRPVQLVLAALLALAVVVPLAPADAQEQEDDIAYEVLSDLTVEPLSLEIAGDGRIIWAQRDGLINVLTPQGVQIAAGRVPTSGNLCVLCEPDPDALTRPPNRLGVGGLEEGGLHGLLLARDFDETGRIFTFRSIPGSRDPETTMGEFHVATFVMDQTTNLIDLSSEETVLTVPAEWDHCCHYGGDLDYLPDGTITLTTGDDVAAEASEGYGPRDHTTIWTNAEITSANPADRRGKILRFREDGSVPDGSVEGEVPNPFIGMEGWNPHIDDSADNPFVGELAGTPGDGWIEFDPYVYSLGWKQPWRAVVHPETGHMYVSDIGPDSGVYDPDRGPAGHEEVNLVPFGGGTHAGWPRCVGPNLPYTDVNWETMEVGEPLDCSDTALVARPIGSADEATWQRGMDPSIFHYTSQGSEEWPIVGSGGKTSEPVAFYPASTDGALRLPERYDNRLFILEWSRNFILTVPYDPATGALDLRNEVMTRVTPPAYSLSPDLDQPYGTASAQQTRLMAPVDAKVGPDGALYLLEYGAFFYAGANGRLSRIRCADCTPADASQNYGLPVDGGMSLPTATAGADPAIPAEARTAAIIALGAGLLAVTWRRRRLVV